ncbi:unnamed protein product [Linum tenue]|uniref:Uncharacterized protein n=1 Tax=Linum tenue TaxID=586396 RepID=A0AAV0JBK1_9ROSI|nr:unnamed protein product [Linum tenue]
MGRSPCCDENGLKKGPWTTEEDKKLVDFIQAHGHGSWRALPKLAGLNRCGKSCRLRWTNYLKPDIKRGKFSPDEEQTILNLHSFLGNKWSAIASHLPGRTDNEIKNFWNTHLKKKLIQMGFDPMTHQPRTDLFATLPQLMALVQLKDLLLIDHPLDHQTTRLQAEALQLAKLQYVQYLLQSSSSTSSSSSNHQNGVVSSTASADIELINLLNSLPNQQLLHHHHQFNNSEFSNMITSSTSMAATQPLHHHNHILLPPLCDPQEEEEQVPFLTQTTTTTTTATNGNDCNNNNDINNNNTNHNNNNEMMNSWPVEVLPSPPPSSLPQTSISNPTAGGGEGTSSSSSSYAGGVTSYNWTELFLDEPILSEISL